MVLLDFVFLFFQRLMLPCLGYTLREKKNGTTIFFF